MLIRRLRQLSSKITFCPLSTLPPNSKRHFERRLLKFSIEESYSVVADVNRYKEFVPWVIGSRILSGSCNEREMEAELVVGFGLFTETYISKISLDKPIQVVATSNQTNLFQNLKTVWKFSPASDAKCCWVTFQIDFEFKSAVYNKLSEMFLQEVVSNMVKAFESQCQKVHRERSKH